MAKTDFLSLYTELTNVSRQLRDLEKQKVILTAQLTTGIPANTEKNGVSHVVTTGNSVSYAKALVEIKDTLIPKTKHDFVPEILARFTTTYEKHTFKAL